MKIPPHFPQTLIDESAIADKILEQEKDRLRKQIKYEQKTYKARIEKQL